MFSPSRPFRSLSSCKRPVALLLIALLSTPVTLAQTSQSSSVRVVVDTTALPRAAGLAMKIEFPLGWTVTDGKNPTIVISAAAPGSKGASNCNLQILDMAFIMGRPGYEVSNQELGQLLSTKASRAEIGQAGLSYVDSGPLTIAGLPAFWTVATAPIKLPKATLGQALYISRTYYRRWQISLLCAELADTEDTALIAATRNQAMFRQIAGSMAFSNNR